FRPIAWAGTVPSPAVALTVTDAAVAAAAGTAVTTATGNKTAAPISAARTARGIRRRSSAPIPTSLSKRFDRYLRRQRLSRPGRPGTGRPWRAESQLRAAGAGP